MKTNLKIKSTVQVTQPELNAWYLFINRSVKNLSSTQK